MLNLKKFSALFLAAVILVLMIVNIGCESDDRKARVRVEAVLKGITKTGEGSRVMGDEETAICTWYMGTPRIGDPGEFERASDTFDRWRKEADIFPYISSFTITGTESAGSAVIVSGTIEGAPFKVRVVEGRPIGWAQLPEFVEE